MRSRYPKMTATAKSRLRAAIRRGACLSLAFAAFQAAARAEDATPAPAATEMLTAAAAWNRIVGNTVTGTTPDGPYSEFFAADGGLRIVDNDGKAGGRWSLRDAKLCTQVDDDDEECRALEVTGASGAFIDAAGSRYRFDILPGNPKGL